MPQLTVAKLRAIKPIGKIERYHDSKGLYLEVSKAGGKYWRWKYTFEGKEKRLSLGAWPDVSLEDVREQRDAFRKLLKEGIDPGTQKGQPRAVGSGEDGAVTFQNMPGGAAVPFYITITPNTSLTATTQIGWEENSEKIYIRTAPAITYPDPPDSGDPVAIWSAWSVVGSGGSADIVGKIELFPFRAGELPNGWYFCNGDQYALSSPQGVILNGFSDNFKSDWGITASGGNISLPNLFHTDGRGFYLRSADGSSKQVGSIEEDAIQKFTGTFGSSIQASSGVFSSTSPYGWQLITSPVYSYFYTTTLNLSNQVRVDDTETRVLSRYMTPAIFLGV